MRAASSARNAPLRSTIEVRSAPDTTAFRAPPAFTASVAYFNAEIPAEHTPCKLAISQGAAPSSPCTIDAWPGIRCSGMLVAHASRSMSSSPSPRAPIAARMASAASPAVVCVGKPVAGSIA